MLLPSLIPSFLLQQALVEYSMRCAGLCGVPKSLFCCGHLWHPCPRRLGDSTLLSPTHVRLGHASVPRPRLFQPSTLLTLLFLSGCWAPTLEDVRLRCAEIPPGELLKMYDSEGLIIKDLDSVSLVQAPGICINKCLC